MYCSQFLQIASKVKAKPVITVAVVGITGEFYQSPRQMDAIVFYVTGLKK